jgi:hypothetical protein
MNDMLPDVPYSKYMLRNVLNMPETTFKTWLRVIEPELILSDPRYSKFCKILTPRAFKFLVLATGLTTEEINQRIRRFCKNTGIKLDESP